MNIGISFDTKSYSIEALEILVFHISAPMNQPQTLREIKMADWSSGSRPCIYAAAELVLPALRAPHTRFLNPSAVPRSNYCQDCLSRIASVDFE